MSCECVGDLFEVPHAADRERHQQLEAGVYRRRTAAHRYGLLRRELAALHVLQIHVRRREDEIIRQLLRETQTAHMKPASFPQPAV